MQDREHILRAYDDELKQLAALIMRMTTLVETQFEAAMRSLRERDNALAERVRCSDADIDALEQEVEHLAVNMIALRQPMANDLRYIVTCLKVSSDIERIGDYARNIGKRVLILNRKPAIPMVQSVDRMAEMVRAMLHDICTAFLKGDSDKALAIWNADAAVDACYTSLFRELLTYMMEDPRHITPCTHLLFIAKHIERMGDLVTNVAESIHYRVTGAPLTDRRTGADVLLQEDAPAG